MEASVFTKIIKGEIPCHKIYEDELTFVFLDIRPVQPGHTLVIPKKQIDHIEDLPDDYYQAVWATVKKVIKRQLEVLGRKRVAVYVEGTGVPHAHVHLMPFNEASDIDSRKVGVASVVDDKILAEMAEKLKIKEK